MQLSRAIQRPGKLGQFIPKASSLHRIACIALYRTLIEHAQHIQLPVHVQHDGPVSPLKHVIRKQFRKIRNLTSPRLVVEALNVGYEAEKTLNAAAQGCTTSLSRIVSFLEYRQSEARSTQVAQAQWRAAQKAKGIDVDKPKLPYAAKIQPQPGVPKLVDVRPRPASELKGRRRVPYLVNTGGVLFLRVKKPQSPFLSRVIRNKLDQRQRRNDLSLLLQSSMVDAKEENHWDGLIEDLRKEEGVAKSSWDQLAAGSAQEKGWEDALNLTARIDAAARYREAARTTELLDKFLAIIDKEKELAAEERQARKEAKFKARMERKAAKSAQTMKASTE